MSEESPAAEAAEVTSPESPEIQSSEELSQAHESVEATESTESTGEAAPSEELQAAVEDAIDAGATEEELKDIVKEYDLTVNGKTRKRKVNVSDDDEMTRILQREAAGQQSMQDAAELRKSYGSFIDELKSDPFTALKQLGFTPDQLNDLNYDFMDKQVQHMKKTPDQIESEEKDEKLRAATEELSQIKQDKEQAEYQRMVTEHRDNLENDIKSTLSEQKELPMTNDVIAEVARTIQWAENLPKDDYSGEKMFPDGVSAADVLPTVIENYTSRMKNMFGNASDDMIEKFLSKERLNKYRQSQLDKVKVAPTSIDKVPATTASVKNRDTKPKAKISSGDFFRNLGRGK